MPDISIVQNRCSLVIVVAVIREIRIYLYIRHRNMEEVHICPSAHIKPDLHK